MVISEQIKSSLMELEKERDIKILYACEAGSRAWGFESKDSDYDVRFIYMKPLEWYLAINEGRKDTIEIMGGVLDFAGWEIRKALRLLKKSNPAILEWINSPIQYVQDDEFMHGLQQVGKMYYSPKSLLFHYLHMARGNIREYLKGKDQVWLKKYLYVVRPLMACNWIERFKTIPPVDFMALCEPFERVPRYDWPASIFIDICGLVFRKKQGDELSYGEVIPSIQGFIETEVERLTQKETQEKWPQHASPKNLDILNDLFRSMLDRFAKKDEKKWENI